MKTVAESVGEGSVRGRGVLIGLGLLLGLGSVRCRQGVLISYPEWFGFGRGWWMRSCQ